MATTMMRVSPSHGVVYVGERQYRAGWDGLNAVVADEDVAACEALGWVPLTVRMLAPQGRADLTPEVSVGGCLYNPDARDGSVWVAEADAKHLVAMGFTVEAQP